MSVCCEIVESDHSILQAAQTTAVVEAVQDHLAFVFNTFNAETTSVSNFLALGETFASVTDL